MEFHMMEIHLLEIWRTLYFIFSNKYYGVPLNKPDYATRKNRSPKEVVA
jgi:hypothetical protein